MKKKHRIDAEERCLVADRQYERMLHNVNEGIIDRDEIVRAMTVINTAHYVAIKENKRHLLK